MVRKSCFTLVFLLFSASAFAQGLGSIAGTVTDQSGSPVALALVTATQVERGTVRTAVSKDQGAYVLPLLPVGTWSLRVEVKGFKPFQRSGIELATEGNLKVDIGLEVGSLTDSIQVIADANMVDTRSSETGTLIDNRRVLELPENGRSVVSLAALLPGAASVSAPQTFTGDRSGPTMSISGSRTTQNLFLFDGEEFNAAFRNTGFNYPPPDAVREVKVLTSSFSAEYGRNSGAVFSVVTRSGTNELHGAAWEFLRNSDLSAKSYFSTTKPALIQNQFGGAAGGPIRKNKLFIFGSYEGLRLRQSSLTSSQTPLTAAERAGDFSGGKTAKDPLTGQPFPGNFIPANRFDPVASKILASGLMPLPNVPSGLYIFNYPTPQNNDQVVTRMDYNLGAHTINGRYNYNHSNQIGLQGSIPQYAPQFDDALSQSVSVGDTWVLRPSLLSEMRVSFNRFATNIANENRTNLADLGANFPVLGPKAPPALNVSGRVAMGSTSSYDEFNVTAAFQLDESLTWTKGNHTVKGGFELLHLRYVNRSTFEENGSLTFDGSITGNAAADFVLGRPVTGVIASPTLEQDGLQLNTYYFVQDDWRVGKRLTLNLGLRYEVPLPWVTPQNYWGTLRPGQQSTVFPTAPTGLVYYGDRGVPRGMIPTDLNNFAPRIGFAWDPFGSGRTAVRGAFGIFYDAINANIIQNATQPFRYTFTIPTPYSLSDPLRGIFVPTTVDLSHPLFTGVQQIDYPDPGTRSPYVEQANFNVQRELVKDLTLEVGYVGKFGHKLPIGWNNNPGLYAPGAMASNLNQRRPLQGFGNNAILSDAMNSSYHSLQVQAVKRFSRHFSAQMAYTFAKSIDLQSTLAEGGGVAYPFNLNSDRGLSDFSAKHIASVTWIYDLPLLADRNPLVRGALGGWELSGIYTVRSGLPFNITTGSDVALSGTPNQRPNVIGNPAPGGGRSRQDQILEWFNPAVFVNPALGAYGDLGRNVVIGPPSVNTNLGAFKNFALPFREGLKLQFRSEYFNLFNQVNLNNPTATVSSGKTFGRITSSGGSRVIQFALKVVF